MQSYKTLQLPLFPRTRPFFFFFPSGKARVSYSTPTWKVNVKPQFFPGHHKRVAVTTGFQWVLTRKHQQELLEQKIKQGSSLDADCLCPALLLHCHGLILVLYFKRAPPFPAMSICQTWLASGWEKIFKWNWQILLTLFTSPLSRDRWQTSACRFLTKTCSFAQNSCTNRFPSHHVYKWVHFTVRICNSDKYWIFKCE